MYSLLKTYEFFIDILVIVVVVIDILVLVGVAIDVLVIVVLTY